MCMKYIVLLRGINISGKNKIAMSELKKILESNNYLNVITYLNSGNVILNSDNSKEYIVDDIRTLIKKKFNLEIPVYVIEHLELKELLNERQSHRQHIPNVGKQMFKQQLALVETLEKWIIDFENSLKGQN